MDVLGVVPLVGDDYEARPRAGLLQYWFEVYDVVLGDSPRLEAADQLQPQLHGEGAFDKPLHLPRPEAPGVVAGGLRRSEARRVDAQDEGGLRPHRLRGEASEPYPAAPAGSSPRTSAGSCSGVSFSGRGA